MEDAFIIHGGKKLKGSVTVSGAKNVALKIIIASLLFDTKVVLENVPRINDVLELLHLVRELGVKAQFTGDNILEVDSTGLNKYEVDLLHASKTRVSFMLFAPLLIRHKKAKTPHPGGDVFIPNPGGCRIGARPIDRIIDGMKALGARVKYNHDTGYYEAGLNGTLEGDYEFSKPTHTGTELLIMLACFAKDTVVLKNCAVEPEIDELVNFLNESGAQIERKGATVTINPAKKLVQKKPFRIMGDRNEAVTFAVLAVMTEGDIAVYGTHKSDLTTFLDKLEKANVGIEHIENGGIRFFHKGPVRPVSIETTVHPGFMTDWQPNWAILMTSAQGASVIHERVFENRFSYVEELKKLGAEIDFIDVSVPDPKKFYDFNWQEGEVYNQAIRVSGPQELHSGVLTIADLRAGATLAIAALCARGESIVHGVSILERGYEDFAGKVQKLGGNIKKV